MSEDYVPPSEWDDATIADKLDTAIKAMLEPASKEEMPQYRATIRIMRKAEMRLRALASSPSQPWISVKDQLPTEHGTYLVSYTEDATERRFVCDDRWYGNWWIDTHTGKVDHWMPLPAAPALGEGER